MLKYYLEFNRENKIFNIRSEEIQASNVYFKI